MIGERRKEYIETKLLVYNIKIIYIRNFVLLERDNAHIHYNLTDFFSNEPNKVISDIVDLIVREELLNKNKTEKLKTLFDNIQDDSNFSEETTIISVVEKKKLIRENLKNKNYIS
jgi:hypothetical protein